MIIQEKQLSTMIFLRVLYNIILEIHNYIYILEKYFFFQIL